MASFDNSVRPDLLLMWMYGIWTMIFLHNSWVSVLLYKNRSRNGSNLLKIIFNIAGLGKALGVASTLLVPDNVSDTGCQAINYYGALDNMAFKMSLNAFLLWRIKQIEFKRSDMYIGFSLLAVTGILQFARMFTLTYSSVFIPASNANVCFGVPPQIYNTLTWISLGTDFAIDIFVTIRLVQILKRANNNAKFVTSNMKKPFKRTLFTSVMYWNFIRLGVAFVFNLAMAINTKFGAQIKPIYIMSVVFTLVYVALSYLITADAEIVRVIEGRPSENVASGSVTAQKPFKGFGFRHGPTSTESTDYVISTPSFNMISSQQIESFDSNTVVASSMKRLSFFEWAKFVVGKKDKNTTNDVEQGSMEEIQEKFPRDNNPEYGVVVTTQEETRRESDYSLATTVIDSKDNHDSTAHAL